MGPLIFVVDSQSESRELLSSCLEFASFTVRSFSALEPEANETGVPALVLFGLHTASDLASGSKTLERTIAGRIPCIIVTDSTSQESQLSALSFAADDWISKPFTPSELVFRVEALLRGASQTNDLVGEPAADIVIDSWAMKLSVRGYEITTSTLEFRLMEYLARHRGQVFSRDFLLDAVWGNTRFVSPRSVDACIARIREKIESDRTNPTMLKTVRGVGYRLDAITAWQSPPTKSCGCRACTMRFDGPRMEASGVIRRKISAQTSST